MLSPERRRSGAIVALLCGMALPLTATAQPATPAAAVVPSPRADELAALASWEARLTGADPAARDDAVAAIGAATPRLLPAVVQRLAELKRGANREAMSSLLRPYRATSASDAGPRSARPVQHAPHAREVDPDAFAGLMRVPRPTDSGWRDAALAAGLCRLLRQMGTLAASRELVKVHEGFGDALRGPVSLELKTLGERAVAALIETRRGENKKLRTWAARLLDALGKTVPEEAVQTSDNQVLADVLRAYGRTRDADAARVVVSFANSDRAVVRQAAREAAAALGDGALWQLREAYENAVGKKPPEGWDWQRLEGELFASYDRTRLVGAATSMEEGLAAERAGNLAAMAAAFDRALARAPDFERAREMVPGYIAFARSLPSSDNARAAMALRRAADLDPSGARANEARSYAALLEAQMLAARGVVDRSAYQQAMQQNPANADAQRALAKLDTGAFVRPRWSGRYALAAALMLVAAVGAALSTFGRRLTPR